MTFLALERRNMVDNQLRTFDVTDKAVLAAMADVPRESFVPEAARTLAYLDRAIPLPGGDEPRAMLTPMVLARLLQALAIEPGANALVVAGAGGYSAACLSALGADVTLLESRADLAEAASANLGRAAVGPGRVRVRQGALEDGASDAAPFDAILIDGAVADPPTGLLEQLGEHGRLACLFAGPRVGQARLYVRSGQGFGFRSLFDATAPVLPAFRRPAAFTF